MSKVNDSLIGQVFYYGTIKEWYYKVKKANNRNFTMLVLSCKCGKEYHAAKYDIISGKQKSCGCYRFECKSNLRHGYADTPIDKVYKGILKRCYNPASNNYKNYGGRGIKVCELWLNNKKAFFEWAEKSGYKKGLSIDRIDVNGNYSPENCRWATRSEQNNNKRNTVYLTENGVKITMRDYCIKHNIKYGAMASKIRRTNVYAY